MDPDRFAQPPANPVANHGAAERSLNAEPETAHRQIIRFREYGEIGTGAALPTAVDGVELRLAAEFAGPRGGA